MIKKITNLHFFMLLLGVWIVTTVTAQAQTDDPATIPPPQSVTIAGTLQPQLGCSGEWNTTCETSQLQYDAEDDLWIATFDLTAGDYEYKAALNGSWDDNYGLNATYYGDNIPLSLAEDGPVTFWYDHKTRWVSDSVDSLVANVPGSFQDEIGCPGDWQPDCLRSLLQDPNGDGVYTFITALIPAGDYEAKVALNQSWDENYGAGGEQDGANIPFKVAENQAVIFTYDPGSNLLTIETSDDIPAGLITDLDQAGGPSGGGMPPPAAPMPDLVVIPGTIQSVLGCPGDWQPDCENTALAFDEEDQVWTAVFDIPAGDYEYKAALNGSWDVNFGQNAEPGGANIPLTLVEDTAVTYLFDHNTGWVADSVNNLIANIPGDFQDEIGCPGDWQPDCLRSWLQDPDGDGNYIFRTTAIPAGSYEAKVAVGQSWAENYGEGGTPDGANISFSVPEDDTLVTFIWNSGSKLLTIAVGEGGGVQGNIAEQRAHWVSRDTIAWKIEDEPGNEYFFHYDPRGGAFALGPNGMEGGTAVPLTVDPDGLPEEIIAKFPHLRNYTALKFDAEDLGFTRIALKGQTAVSAQDSSGQIIDATGLQIPGVLDDLYTYDGALGVVWAGDTPSLNLWAPTARLVKLHLFDDSDPASKAQVKTMRVDPDSGVWHIAGEPDWQDKYYLYEVQVYVPGEGVVTNLVTDPYSLSLSQNSQRSQIVNLADPTLLPDGWDGLEKPHLATPEDISIYELHVRDFSVNDDSVPDELKGTFAAFTLPDSNGMKHLRALAEAGLTHLHLLPAFDIATIDEDKTTWVSNDFAKLAQFPPDSEEQQALVEATADKDGFNWGYDPLHYTVPEGSYSTDPDGPQRIVEFRQMVQSLNQNGLRLVMDVVYNHTNAAGQSENAVLDRIVPGYYHRLNNAGKVERSTCCANTATEHNMMRKLMVDSVLTWATAYKVDGFRFDLMGHHMKDDMLAVRAALDGLTLADDGVDGKSIYIYGEGWNFGEVADNARGINATQLNMAGTGIGTFNDRVRDAIRGGNPFGDYEKQGFSNGLYTDPNDADQGSEADQLAKLLELSDHIRVGLAGNLKAYELVNAAGETVTGKQVLYNGQFAGYTEDPQENIVYASAHDNETLFDAIQYKAPASASIADRVRMQNLGLSVVALSQGVPFFHAGSDMLRSKDFDRDSFNSGDWFNKLDFTYETNNWGVGLPVAGKNQENWPLQQPRLANPDLAPDRDAILQNVNHFQEILAVRSSSPLFRLQTAVDITDRIQFHNTGPEQIPGLIVMSISDTVGADLDPARDGIVVLFNASPEAQTFTIAELAGTPYDLHPIQQNSADMLVREAGYDGATGTFTVPARTTAVFQSPQRKAEEEVVEAEVTPAPPVEEEMVEEDTAVETPPEHETESAAPAGPDKGAQLWLGALLIGLLFSGLAALLARPKKNHG